MNVTGRLDKLEQAAQAEKELNARIIAAINERYGSEEGLLAAAATVTTPPEYEFGMDLFQFSDAELAAIMCGQFRRPQERQEGLCQ